MDGNSDLTPEELREREEIFGPTKQEVRPNIVTEAEKNDPLRAIKVNVHSMLVAEQTPINTREVEYKFYDMFGYELDPSTYGYGTIDDLLHAMPDKVNPIEKDGFYLYSALKDERTADIRSLVERQLTLEQQFAKRLQKKMYRKPTPTYTIISKINWDDPRSTTKLKVSKDVNRPIYPVRDTQKQPNFSKQPLQNGVPLTNMMRNVDNYKWDIPLASDIARAQSVPLSQGVPLENILRPSSSPVNPWLIPCQYNQTNNVKTDFADNHDSLTNLHGPSQIPNNVAYVQTQNMEMPTLIKEESVQNYNKFEVQPATEKDLIWLGSAPFLMTVNKFTKASVLYMISPKSFLVATLWGNGGREKRFLQMNALLCDYVRKNRLILATVYLPGRLYIIRCGDEYARGILIHQGYVEGTMHFACFDYHGTADISPDNVYVLPAELSEKSIPGNVFLARIRGVERVYKEDFDLVQNSVTEPGQWEKTSTFGVIFDYAKIRGEIHVACIDILIPNSNREMDWLSNIILSNKLGYSKPNDHQSIDKNLVIRIIERLDESDYFHIKRSNLWATAPVPVFVDMADMYPDLDKIITKISIPVPKTQKNSTAISVEESTDPFGTISFSIDDEATINQGTSTFAYSPDHGEKQLNQINAKKSEEMSCTHALYEMVVNSLPLIKDESRKVALIYKYVEFAYMLKTLASMTEEEKGDMDILVEDLLLTV